MEVKKKYEATYSYYKNPQKFPISKIPLSLNKTVIGEHKFVEIENIIKQIQVKSVSYNKAKINQKLIKFFVTLITIIGCIFVCGNYIFLAVKKLIELIVK